ncbi:MAG: hypothetical protein GYB32_04565 [Algicola sp.]|nr:hypothetical protein [Algicola sp.]
MKFYKNFIVFWTIVYLGIAFIGRFTSSHKEYFPFFRWSLYSKTPNTMSQAYIMVTRVGDSTFQEAQDVRNLWDYHHVNAVDLNLIVQDFFKTVTSKTDFKDHQLFNVLPENSDFELYELSADLSLEDYKSSQVTKKILLFKNGDYYFE